MIDIVFRQIYCVVVAVVGKVNDTPLLVNGSKNSKTVEIYNETIILMIYIVIVGLQRGWYV